MNILVFTKNSPTSYSGGRYHSFLMAKALSEAGHHVVYMTNHRPVFLADFDAETYDSEVSLLVGNLLVTRVPPIRFDVVVVVLHLNAERLLDDDYFFYRRAVTIARRNAAPLVVLSFESPNWIHMFQGGGGNRRFRYWDRIASQSDVILSSTMEGNRHAREYYRQFNDSLLFEYCYPSINSRVCDLVESRGKERRVMVITRFSDAHKNARSILRIIGSYLQGYTLEIINGSGNIPSDIHDALLSRCNENNVTLELRTRISDRDKFRDLKRAQLLVFPSLFEGFGLPPVEAQYSGTRVLAFDLPVLREVSPHAANIEFVPRGNYDALAEKCRSMISENYRSELVRDNISHIAKFEGYVERVHSLFENLRSRFERRKVS